MISYLANPHRFMAFSKIALPVFAVLAAGLLTRRHLLGALPRAR